MIECPGYCSDCSTYDNCKSCADGYYLQEKQCFECNSSCKVCSNVNSCSACHDSYILDIKSGKCLSNCVKGYHEVACDIETDSLICCKEICGDGLIFTLPCDDRNTFDGDGCSSTCNMEPNFFCSYDYKKMLSICHHITPLTANISLPYDSATLIQIQFNQAIIGWNQNLLEYITFSFSIPNAINSSNVTFTDNMTIVIDLDYNNNVSFKSAEITINFTNPNTFIGSENQTLQTNILTQELPNYYFYSFKEQQIKNSSSFASNSIGTTSSFITTLSPLATYFSGLFWSILSSLQFVFYLSLLKIKYPDNFKTVIKQSFQPPFNFIPNFISNYSHNNKILSSIASIFTQNNFSSIFIINNGSSIIYLGILFSIHSLLALTSKGLNKPRINFLSSEQYFQIFLSNAAYLILSMILSIFQISYSNWFTAVSSIISFLFLIVLIIWIHKKYAEQCDKIEDNIANFQLWHPKFKSSASIFGIIDLLQMMILSLFLVIFENMPIVNTIFIALVKLVYMILVIRHKPSENNMLLIFNEAGNLILALMSTLFVLDDNFDWFTETTRIIIGWVGIACVFGNILIQLLLAFFQFMRKHKSTLQKCCNH